MDESEFLTNRVDRLLGQLEARMAAMEDRLTRNELTSAAQQAAIEAKLDRVATTLALGMGGLRIVHWIGGASLAAAGFIASHLLHPKN